jgi:hypothetical protein
MCDWNSRRVSVSNRCSSSEALIRQAATAPPQFPRHQGRKAGLSVRGRKPRRLDADRSVSGCDGAVRNMRRRVRRSRNASVPAKLLGAVQGPVGSGDEFVPVDARSRLHRRNADRDRHYGNTVVACRMRNCQRLH